MDQEFQKLAEVYEIDVNPKDTQLINESLEDVASKLKDLVEELHKMLHIILSSESKDTVGGRKLIGRIRSLLIKLEPIEQEFTLGI